MFSTVVTKELKALLISRRFIGGWAACTVLILLMSLIIGAIQWAVGERKLGRRKTPQAAALVAGA